MNLCPSLVACIYPYWLSFGLTFTYLCTYPPMYRNYLFSYLMHLCSDLHVNWIIVRKSCAHISLTLSLVLNHLDPVTGCGRDGRMQWMASSASLSRCALNTPQCSLYDGRWLLIELLRSLTGFVLCPAGWNTRTTLLTSIMLVGEPV